MTTYTFTDAELQGMLNDTAVSVIDALADAGYIPVKDRDDFKTAIVVVLTDRGRMGRWWDKLFGATGPECKVRFSVTVRSFVALKQ